MIVCELILFSDFDIQSEAAASAQGAAASTQGKPHHWKKDELDYLMQIFKEPDIEDDFTFGTQMECCDTIAKRMNTHFKKINPILVPFTADKVKTKLKAITGGTLNLSAIQTYSSTYNSETQDQGGSLSSKKKKCNSETILKLMKDDGATVAELIDCSEVLHDKSKRKHALKVFPLLSSPEDRKDLFADLVSKQLFDEIP